LYHTLGYYRINYEYENWSKILSYYTSQYLDSGKKNISVINRAKVIDDMFHLMIERQFKSFFVSWNLPEFLWLETTDFVVWYPMLKMFEHMSNAIPFYENSISIIVKVISIHFNY